MINRQQQPAWPITVDQEGNNVTREMVLNERIACYQAQIETERSTFEDALETKCYDTNEIFNKLGYNPEVGEVIYQVGFCVYALKATINGIVPAEVGRIQ